MSPGHFSAVQDYGNLVPHFHIVGSSDNLNSLRADIYLAYNKLLRIRMLFYGNNLSYDNLFQILIPSLIPFHLRAGQCHCVAVFLIRAFQFRHICFNP